MATMLKIAAGRRTREIEPSASDPTAVLVLDDDRITLEVIARRIEQHGYLACRTFTLAQAQEQLLMRPFPVCLIDFHLGRDDRGIDLIAWARDRGIDTEFIVVTASERREDVVSALRSGAFDFVEKPVDTELLMSAVARATECVTARRSAALGSRQLQALTESLEMTVRDRTEKLLEQWHVTNELLTGLPLGILRIDGNWSVDQVNPAAERILGRGRGELIGPIYRSAILSPIFDALKQASDEGRWGFARPLQLERSGDPVWVEYRIVLLRPTADTFRGAAVVLEEISEKVQLERAIRDSERLASFGRTAEQLAKQLRDGLMSVVGWAEVVCHRLSPTTESEDVENLMQSVEKCHALIEQSLNNVERPGKGAVA